MSGGPIFNENGELCGLICSSIPSIDNTSEHVSWVSSLWPMMGIEISLNREGYSPNSEYPIVSLAADGFISAHHWQNIRLQCEKNTNKIMRITLNDNPDIIFPHPDIPGTPRIKGSYKQ